VSALKLAEIVIDSPTGVNLQAFLSNSVLICSRLVVSVSKGGRFGAIFNLKFYF
jgi:hypothetical protein